MLVKEYRIPLPLSVEEYKIAQLYMIAKKSKEESLGSESGVEILKNEPYEEGPGGSGQYTYKIYHVGQHLPAWLKALLPKSALTVEEMAWNSYPYTKTRYTCPFIEKFSIEIETKYFNDSGNRINVFNLTSSEINRQIDFIDIVKEQVSECPKEENPRTYVSQKTRRGPLTDDWVNEYWNDGAPVRPLMCAYKLCRVEFKYWGMQNKIEKFIHDSALRKTMVTAHQQAWAWQDEWVDLTMADIRLIELQTQEYLRQRMAGDDASVRAAAESVAIAESATTTEPTAAAEPAKNILPTEDSSQTLTSVSAAQVVDFNIIDQDNIDSLLFEVPKSKKNSISQYSLAPSQLSNVSKDSSDEHFKRRSAHWSRNNSRNNSRSTLHSPGECIDAISAWRIQSLARDSDSSSDEFYDAEDVHEENSSYISHPTNVSSNESEDNIFSAKFLQRVQSDLLNKPTNPEEVSVPESPASISPTHQVCHQLYLILHGGSILDVSNETSSAAKKIDIMTFTSKMDQVIASHYPQLMGRIAVRYVSCPPICLDSLMVLSSLSPYTVQSPSGPDAISQTFSSIPLGALPLFAISSFDYQENLINVKQQLNKTYLDFLKSDEGKGFTGKVTLIGDSVGAILGFDALCHGVPQNNLYGSELSIQQDTPDINKTLQLNPIISVTDSLNSVETDDSCQCPEQSRNALSKSRTLPASSNVRNLHQPKQTIYCKSLSHPGDSAHCDISNRLLISSTIRRRSSGSSDLASTKLDFEVGDFFMFGSLLGIILTYRKMLSFDEKSLSLSRPLCDNLFNLFHPSDPSALRIEPLLSARFSYIPPVNVPRFQKFPLGDGQPIHLLEYLQTYWHLFSAEPSTQVTHTSKSHVRRISDISISSSNCPIDNLNMPSITSMMHRWWGSKRIDYALYCPEGLSNFPSHSLPHIFHSSYWESTDVISFILRQNDKLDVYSSNLGTIESREVSFKPNQPREKWQRKRTSVKMKNITANHRANDVIVKEGVEQTISGRFMYGPFDMVALTGEKVDIHMRCSRTGEWQYMDTRTTEKSGRLTYSIAKEKSLPCGLYQFKLVVRGDHTSLDLWMDVVPPRTEAVVFSIDGSLTASVSVSGKDPKVRAGSVDVVRFWQELGYLIIYITGRPDIQQQRILQWLGQHNFPHGLTYFVDGLSTDPLRHKADYLKTLSQKMEIIFRAAYGSNKDISVYQSLDLKANQIYAVGKISKKHQSAATALEDGYVVHLEELKMNGLDRPAQNNGRVVLPRGGFSGLRSKHSQKVAKRTISYPLSGDTNGSSTASMQSTSNVINQSDCN